MLSSKDRRSKAIAVPFGGAGRRRAVTLSLWLGKFQQAFVTAVRLEVDRRRLFLWLPVIYGVGVIGYFQAESEPALLASALPAVALGLLAFRLRARFAPFALCLALSVLFAGFAVATLRTAQIAHPVLATPVMANIQGRVVTIDRTAYGARLVIDVLAMQSQPASEPLQRVRVTVRGKVALTSGDTVELRARLTPPSPPAVPGGFDFQREAYFQRLAAVGTGSDVKLVASSQPAGLAVTFEAMVDRARNQLTQRIIDVIGGSNGAIAAALVTGKRGEIAERDNDAWRAAGIFHIISISGLHMAMAAGLFFWFARISFALLPARVLAFNTKKCAALVAMAGVCAYYVMSGQDVAAERSVIMTLVMLGAILFDRPALAMRNLAISGLIVLSLRPESLLGPSFQMSFGAVAGLVAYGEFMRRRRELRAEKASGATYDSVVVRGIRIAGDFAATSLIAGLCTAPFQAFHFHRLNPYGLLGNSLAVPICSIIVMPAALLGVVLYPLGLDAPAWWLMGQGIAAISAFAQSISTIGGAIADVGRYPAVAMGIIALALAWFTIMTTRMIQIAAMPILIVGALLALTATRPNLILDASGQVAMLRGDDGKLVAVGQRRSAFSMQQWLSSDRDGRKPSDVSLTAGAHCDASGCAAKIGAERLAVVTLASAFVEDCERATIIVTALRAPAVCWETAEIYDRAYFERFGSTYVYGEGAKRRFETTRNGRENRPWIPVRRQSQPSASTVEAPEPDPDQ